MLEAEKRIEIVNNILHLFWTLKRKSIYIIDSKYTKLMLEAEKRIEIVYDFRMVLEQFVSFKFQRCKQNRLPKFHCSLEKWSK